jgi:hypothetical protein
MNDINLDDGRTFHVDRFCSFSLPANMFSEQYRGKECLVSYGRIDGNPRMVTVVQVQGLKGMVLETPDQWEGFRHDRDLSWATSYAYNQTFYPVCGL